MKFIRLLRVVGEINKLPEHKIFRQKLNAFCRILIGVMIYLGLGKVDGKKLGLNLVDVILP